MWKKSLATSKASIPQSTSTSASRRARLQIQLRRLEAEQELSKKKAALEIETEFIRKKFEALEASIVDDSVSVRSKISKGRSDQLVRDWMANLKSIPVGESNQEATNVHEEIEGAVGGVVEKTSSEENKGKIHTPCLAARSPENEDCSKRVDHVSSRQSCPMPVSNELENLRQMLDQYEALYFAEKEKNRQNPSVLLQECSKGARPKQLESSKPADDCHLSSTPKFEQQEKELPTMQYKLSYSAIDGLGQAEHMAVKSTNDHHREDVLQRSANTSRRHESSPTDGHTAVGAISAAPTVDGLEGNTHFRCAAPVQTPNVAPL
nr:uncharacterized protein LOC115254816 [Aedes albopictus]